MTMARSSQPAMASLRHSTRIQPASAEAPASRRDTIQMPRVISFTTAAKRDRSAAISAAVPGCSKRPLWGGPPAIARSQNDPHISSHATSPSASIFNGADPIDTGWTSS